MSSFGELPILGPEDFESRGDGPASWGDRAAASAGSSPRELLSAPRRDLLELIETVRDLVPQLLADADTFAPLAVVMDQEGGVEMLPGPDDAEHGLIELLDEVIRERVAEGTIRAAGLVTAVLVRAAREPGHHHGSDDGRHHDHHGEPTPRARAESGHDDHAPGGLRSVEAVRLELDHQDDRPFACFLPWFRPAVEPILGEAWLERSERAFFGASRAAEPPIS